MPFQNLRVNSEFFILHKDNTPYIEVGSVSGVSTPVAEFMQQPLPYGQPPRMVVDAVSYTHLTLPTKLEV